MAIELFTGQHIAFIWDFDKTLSPGYMQEPLFEEYEINSGVFWAEVNALKDHYAGRGIVVSEDTLYLNHLLTYVRAGKLEALTNDKLRELGTRIKLYPGMPDFLNISREQVLADEKYASHGITVEHYVVSTGLRQMILGSGIADQIDDVWACEFIEDPATPGFLEATEGDRDNDGTTSGDGLETAGREISQVGYFLDNTTKTRAIWEINKGVNKDPRIQVNDFIAPEDRRVPLRNMIYIADGPSDVPVFSILNKEGGATLGVYNPDSEAHFEEVRRLSDQGRVQLMAEADYGEGTTAYRWLLSTMHKIADQIVHDRNVLMSERVQPPSHHVT